MLDFLRHIFFGNSSVDVRMSPILIGPHKNNINIKSAKSGYNLYKKKDKENIIAVCGTYLEVNWLCLIR